MADGKMSVVVEAIGLICGSGSCQSLKRDAASPKAPITSYQEEKIDRRALKFARGFSEYSDVSDSDMTRDVSWVLD